MMKMTSSTSITSMSGIMLISAIAAGWDSCLKPPKAISGSLHRGLQRHHRPRHADRRAGGEDGVKVMRIRIELGEHKAVGAHERVVGEHRGHRDREAERGHDQG